MRRTVALERRFRRPTVLLSVGVLALVLIGGLCTPLPAASQTSQPNADNYEYLAAVIETLGLAQTAGTREQSVPSKGTAGTAEVLIAYATASKLAASDYAVTAERLVPYLENQDAGINKSARTLVGVYRSLQQVEMQTYDARILILRGNANSSDMRVRAAELRSTRQVGLENMLLTMRMVRFAIYDMRPEGNPNATLRSAITEDQRQRLLQSIRTLLGEQVTAGPREDQDAAVAAGAFLFQELSKVDPRGPKGK